MSGRKSSTGSMKQTTLASFFKKPSTPKAPEEPQATKGPGAEVVGRRLKVWWPADEAWYAGGVASYDGERHAIQYDDGDEEAVDLSKEKFEFLEGTHAPKDVKRETKRPAPSAGLTAEQRADRERKRRKAADSDDDFVVDDDASISEEEEEDEVFDESDDDDKPKPKKRRVIADDSDEEMPAAKASPSSVPVSTDKKTTRPGTPTPFDASGFHDRYRKRSAPVSADKRESYDLVELTDQKVDSHDSEKKSVLPAGCHTHDVDPKYAFLTTARRDADGRTPDDPLFNARTLKVDWHKEPVKQLTGTQQTWWQVKETHADCVLFYKIGKFYELYHTDADVGVAEAGLVYMKGDQAHAGFPELAYGKYVEALVSKGFKVCRVEQTETPDQVKKRIAGRRGLSKIEKGMRREVCSLTTPGTRLYTVLDMRLEKEGGGFEPVSGPTHLAAVCEQGSTVGVCVCDSPTGTFTLAEFEDDVQRTRLRTLLAALPPAEVLVPRGSSDLAEICERATGASVELLTPQTEFLDADSCIEYLTICGAFPKASKQGNDNDVSARWPPVLRTAVRGRADSALSAMGAVAWWLRRALVDVELLSMRRVDAYVPPDLGEAPESTSAFVPHDEAQLLEAALAISSTDDDDDWRAALRRKAPRMALDATTLKNLEVLKSSAPDGWSGSLWHLTHHCRTAFGGRLLRDWLSRPLLEKRDIDARADAVQELVESPDLYEGLAKALKQKGIGDLERALQQLHTLGADRRAPSSDGKQHPDARAILFDKLKFDARRVKQLCSAISGLERCASVMDTLSTKEPTSDLLKRLAPGSPQKSGGGCFPSLEEKLRPFRQFNLDQAKDKGVLQSSRGADPAADQAEDLVKAREKALDDWLKEAQSEHGCSLKWKHSAKDRYCVEAADVLFGRGGKLERLPAGWQQRSKTKKARSFAVPALKSLIQALEDAESSEKDLKADQMRRLFKQFDESRDRWACAVKCVATLDALLSLAKASREPGYCRAELLEGDGSTLKIEDGAHPCLAGDVVPNDLTVGGDAPHLLLLSGPNMGGKSTLLRQACVAAILAQVGCFVKAKSCTLHPVDRVFTRLGASDKILEGQSTFMVELLETASILKNATEKSLVILDELGRGTATFDGAAIAHSVVDHLVKQAKCRALFATHYHDLVRSWSSHDSVQLGHMDCLVRDGGENVVFLYKLAEGCSPKSFGINVARLARLPKRVLERAAEKSAEFEDALMA